MIGLIEPLLDKHEMRYVRLDGSVPQKKRQVLVQEFSNDPDCRVFITTNAGSTGLNLQAANTVINVDLPWNPAVLEQRIGRAHRMGQTSNVQVYVLVTEDTIEENLLTTLSAKHELSLAALDVDSDVDVVSMESGIEELKRRLESLLGAKPEAPTDESQQLRTEQQLMGIQQRERIAAAGGQLLSAAFALLTEMVPETKETPEMTKVTEQFRNGLLSCLERDEQGRPKLTVTLPDTMALEGLARTLSHLFPAGQ
jgi:superfamily II DNA/RNA helicase